MLYINTLITYVNKEQLPNKYGSEDYDYSQEEEGIDDLREWAKTKLEEVSMELTNWNREAESGETKPSKL